MLQSEIRGLGETRLFAVITEGQEAAALAAMPPLVAVARAEQATEMARLEAAAVDALASERR